MIRKIILVTLLVFAGIILAGWTISFFYADKIKAVIISEINKKLNAPVSVGQIDFSLIRNFPEASVVFDEVFIREKNADNPDTLLYAKRVSFLLNIFQLVNKDYSIKQVIVENSIAHLKINAEGVPNYEIWKTDTNTIGPEAGVFKLEQVLCNNAEISYKHELKQINFQTFVNEGKLRGEFSKKFFDLDIQTDMQLAYFNAEGITYIRQKKSVFSLLISIDENNKKYTIKKAELQVAGLHFLVDGYLTSVTDGMLTKLHVSSPGSGPQELLSLIPHKEVNKADEFNYKGTVNFDMKMDGLWSKKISPLIQVSFGAVNVSVIPKNGDAALHHVSFTGNYSNKKSGKLPVSYLSVKNVKASLNKNELAGDFEITDFEKPFLSARLSGAMDLSILSRFFKPDTVESMTGSIQANISFSGKIGVLNTYKASGSLELMNLNFTIKQKAQAFSGISGSFALDGNNVEMKNLTGKIGSSDFEMNGTFTNLFAYLLLPGQQLFVKSGLICRNLDVDELMEKKITAKKDTLFKLHFPELIAAEINISVDQLHFQKFEAAGLAGSFLLKNQSLVATGVRFNSMEGNVQLNGSIIGKQNDSLLIAAEARIGQINITQLFYQMGNFGQDVIEDKNLKGHVTANVQFASVWSSNLVCNTAKVYTNADITIENGELINFEPTMALSKYVKGADLRNIKFSTLTNKVEIKNRVINFATMEVKSSAMDITASGTHTFDNIVDYKIRLLLSQLLGKKVKEQNTEFGMIEDDGLGRTSIFLRMSGPMKNPKFTYDNKAVEEKFVGNIKSEKQNLKKVLNQEFGWFKKDTAVVKKEMENPKKEDIQVDYDEGEK